MGIGSLCLPVLRVQQKAAVALYPAGLVGLICYMPGGELLTPALSWCWQDLSRFLTQFCAV